MWRAACGATAQRGREGSQRRQSRGWFTALVKGGSSLTTSSMTGGAGFRSGLPRAFCLPLLGLLNLHVDTTLSERVRRRLGDGLHHLRVATAIRAWRGHEHACGRPRFKWDAQCDMRVGTSRLLEPTEKTCLGRSKVASATSRVLHRIGDRQVQRPHVPGNVVGWWFLTGCYLRCGMGLRETDEGDLHYQVFPMWQCRVVVAVSLPIALAILHGTA